MKRTSSLPGIELDPKIRPQDDFFQHVNRAWIRKNPIPASRAAWSAFSVLVDEVRGQLKELLEKLARSRVSDPGEKKLRELYRVAMDVELTERLGGDPVMEELARIDAVDTRAELPALIARLHNMNARVFWNWYVDPDYKRNTLNILEIHQSGLGMPDRDYYLKNDAKSAKLREEYAKTIVRLMRLAGWSAKDAAVVAKATLAIEKKLAQASMSGVELRDIPSQYNKMSLAVLTRTAPFDWKAYYAAVGVPAEHARTLIVCQPRFMKVSAELLKKLPLEDIKAYLSWAMVRSAAPYLSEDFEKAHFAFYGKALSGRKEMEPRWKRVQGEIDQYAGELLGKLYVKKHFPGSSKKRVDALIEDLFATYRSRMTALPWMSVSTIAKAIEKLDAMERQIGYPRKWESFATFKPDSSSYLAMHWSAVGHVVKRELGKLGKPVDRSKWGMSPQSVNAYCSFTFNQIVFPAGILQKPFFDPKWSDALNYGSIGAVIGHELTHAFDDMGAGFDKDGNLKNWWSKADKRKFDVEAKKLAKQYGQYVVIDGMRCNGELTLGENIADIGGVAIAYEALSRRVGDRMHEAQKNGFTVAQEFFIGNARTWGESVRPEQARRLLITDEHAPPSLRINAALQNLQEFHDAFDIRPGDRLYRKPEDRVSIW